MIDGLVSTIVPVFNRPDLLREAVGSVLEQTYRPIEVIVVDDGSTDATARVADELAGANPGVVRVIHQDNSGVGAARETGRRAARGEFMQYLDSDDVLLPRRFELLVAALRAHPDCAIAYGRTRHLDEHGSVIACDWKPLLAGEAKIFPHFLRGRLWETGTALFRMREVDQVGAWLPLRLEEDWEYDCRFGARGVLLTFVDETLNVIRATDPGRLSLGAWAEHGSLRDRVVAESLILQHAQMAGVSRDSAEMEQFVRRLFLLARQCGAAGLPRESRTLFRLARGAMGPSGPRLQFLLYGLVAGAMGWSRAGKLADRFDRFRERRRSPVVG